MSQNHKNGQTTQTSYVKTARLLWVNEALGMKRIFSIIME